jgi:hypothetical protein
MVNFSGGKDCPKAGCVHYKGRALVQKPFLKEYHEWVAVGGSSHAHGYEWKNMGDALNKWTKRNAKHDASKARKIITKVLEKYIKKLGKRGLKVDYDKDDYTFRVDHNYATYRMSAATKSSRIGSPGGEHLIDVLLYYYPDGVEAYGVANQEIDDLLGPFTYGNVLKDIEQEFKKTFPAKLHGRYGFLSAHKKKGLKVPSH